MFYLQEEKLKDKPGYEHLNEPLHVLVEAEFPEDVINARLDYAMTILENLLKPVVWTGTNVLFSPLPVYMAHVITYLSV